MTSSDPLAAALWCGLWGVCRPLQLGEVAGNCSRIGPGHQARILQGDNEKGAWKASR